MANAIKRHLGLVIAIMLAFSLGGALCGAALAASGSNTAYADDASVANEVQRGNLTIYKYDAQTGLSSPQGGASLAGATFRVWNTSPNDIVYYYDGGHKKTVFGTNTTGTSLGGYVDIEVKAYDSAGNVVEDPTNNQTEVDYYAAKTDADALPYGSYHVQEVSGSDGYGLINKDNVLTHQYVSGILLSNGQYSWIDGDNADSNNYIWATKGYDFKISADNQSVVYDSVISMNSKGTGSATNDYNASTKSGCQGPAAFNIPIRGELHVQKQDSDTQTMSAQGDATIEGAVFQIVNVNKYAVTVWGEYSDELGHGVPLLDDADGDGWYEPGEVVATIKTGANGEATTYADALPCGWYKINELSAPDGYVVSSQTKYLQIDNDDWDSGPTTKIQDPVIRGGATFNKVDYDYNAGATKLSSSGAAQGDASLAGAEITIVNASDHAVFIYGSDHKKLTGVTDNNQGSYTSCYYQASTTRMAGGTADKLVQPGEVVATIVTDDNGEAYIKQLPYGTYTATETKAAPGYQLNTEWSTTFTIREGDEVGNNTHVDATDGNLLTQKVYRGDIDVAKVDGETYEHSPLGGATLQGAEITVKNRSAEPVVVYCDAEGNPYELDGNGYPTQTRTIKSGDTVAVLTTDENGYAGIDDLPYGTYELTETKAPKGYTLDTTWKQMVQVREDGKVYDLTEYNADAYTQSTGGSTQYSALADLVIREDFYFKKIDSSGSAMDGVAFLIRSQTTGEWHLLVTNNNGVVDTRAYMANDDYDTDSSDLTWWLHSYQTNADDTAYDETANTADASKFLTSDEGFGRHGYWMYGYNSESGFTSKVDDTRSALPYDDYDVIELRCDANKGMTLFQDTLHIDQQNNTYISWGTLTDKPYTPENPSVPVTSQGVDAYKTSDPAPNSQVSAGDTITYTISYENTLSTEVASIHLRDYIPDGTTYVEGSAEGSDCDAAYVSAEDSANGRAYVEWTTNAVAVGGTGDVSYQVTVNSTAPSIIENQTLYDKTETKLVPGDPTNDDPAGSTNVVRHTTDGTPCGSSIRAWKEADPAAGSIVNEGDEITYTIHLVNEGDEATDTIGVYDTIPYGTSIVTTEDEDGYDVPAIEIVSDDTDLSDDSGYMIGSGAVGWTIGQIGAGDEVVLSFKVKVNSETYNVIDNQASWGVSHGNKVVAGMDNTTNYVEHVVSRLPQISIEKSVSPESGSRVAAGDILTYTLTVTNNGRGNAYDVPVYDLIDATNTKYVADSVTIENNGHSATDETPYVAWSIGKLAKNGGSVTMSYQVRVNDDVKAGTVISNTAVAGGEDVLAALDDVTDNETLLDSFFSWLTGIFGGESESSTSPTTDVSVATLSNEVTNVVADALAEGGIETSKTAEPEDGSYVEPGDEITYTITWKNNSDVSVNGFAVRDAIPEHTTYKQGSLIVTGADGVSSTDVKNNSSDTDYDDNNVVSVEEESIVWTEAATVVNDAEAVYDAVVLDKSTQSVENWDEIVNWLGTAKAGERIEFVVTNSAWYDTMWRATIMDDGRIKLLCHVLVDNTDNSVNFVQANGIWGNYSSANDAVYAIQTTLAPGETGSMTFTVTVDEDTPYNTDIINAFTYGNNVYGSPASDLPYKGSNETVHYVGSPELVGTKTVDKQYAASGDLVTYTVSVTNEGTASARDVALYDEIASNGVTGVLYHTGSYSVSGSDAAQASKNIADSLTTTSKQIRAKATELAPGETVTMTFAVVLADVGDGDVIINQATFADNVSGEDFTAQSNKTNEVKTTVDTPALSIVKTSDPVDGEPVMPGQEITYTITVTNPSDVEATDVAVYDAVPANTTLVNGSLKNLTAYGTSAVVANDGTIGAGQSATYSFKVKVNEGASDGTAISNTATAGITDKTVTGPLSIASNTVSHNVSTPNISITKTADPADGSTVAVGDVITYTIELANNSSALATGVAVYDAIPSNATYVSGSASDGLEYTDGAVTAYGIDIGANKTQTYTFKVKVNDVTDGSTVSNMATAGYSNEKPAGPLEWTSNTVSNTIAKPDIRLVKTSSVAADEVVAPGDIITYTVTAYNDGDLNASGVGIYDAIPEGTTYVDGSLVATGGVAGKGYVASYVGDVAAHSSAAMTFKVKVDDGFYGSIENQASWDYLLTKAPTGPTSKVSNLDIIQSGTPDVSVIKTQDIEDGALVTPGDEITYTVRATNLGNVSAAGVGLYDVIPAGTSYVAGSLSVTGAEGAEVTYDSAGNSTSATVVGDKASADEGNSTLTVGAVRAYTTNLDENASVVMTYKVKVNAGYVGEIVNQCTWDWGLTEASMSQLSRLSNDMDAVSILPEMSIYKVQDPANGSYVTGGDTLTYTVTVKNTGEVKAYNVGIYDMAPEHTTYVEGSLSGDGTAYVGEDGLLTIMAGDMEPGEKATLTFQAKIDVGFVGTIHNRGLWVSPAADPTVAPIEGTEADTSTEVEAASGSILSTLASIFNMPSIELLPQTGSMLFIPEDSAGAMPTELEPQTGFTVVVPEGSASGWSNDTGEADDQSGTDAADTDNADAPADSGTTTDTDKDDTESGNTGSDMTGDNTGTTNSGDTNKGNTESGNTDTSGSSAGTSTDPVPSYEVPNTGTTTDDDKVLVPSEDTEGAGSNETEAHVIAPTLEVTKAQSPADGSYVKAGDTVSYTITAKNVGKVNAWSMIFEDAVPDGLTIDEDSIVVSTTDEDVTCEVVDNKLTSVIDIPIGESATIVFNCTVDDDAEGDLVNHVNWAQTTDGKMPTEYKTSNDVVAKAVDPSVEVLKSVDALDGTYIAKASTLTYTLTVTNKGEVAATPIITDVMDSNVRYIDGSFKVSDESFITDHHFETASATLEATAKEMAVGESFTITYQVKVADDVAANTAITNKATWVDVDEPDVKGESNDVTNIIGEPVISVTKAVVEPDTSDEATDETLEVEVAEVNETETTEADAEAAAKTYEPGDEIAYAVTVANTGTLAGKVTMTDVIPEGMTFVEGSLSEGATYADGKITYEASIDPSQTATITYTVKVDNGAYAKTLTNTVSWKVDEADEQTTSTDVTTGAPKVELNKVVDKTEAIEGEEITYTVHAINSGDAAAADVVISDVIPEGTTYVADSASVVDSEGAAALGATVEMQADETGVVTGLSYKVGVLKAGETSYDLTFKVTANDLADDAESGTVANVAIEADTYATAVSDEVTTTIKQKPEPALSITKTASTEKHVAGEDVTYTITLDNTEGTAAAENVIVTDVLPDGMTLADVDANAKWAKFANYSDATTYADLAAAVTDAVDEAANASVVETAVDTAADEDAAKTVTDEVTDAADTDTAKVDADTAKTESAAYIYGETVMVPAGEKVELVIVGTPDAEATKTLTNTAYAHMDGKDTLKAECALDVTDVIEPVKLEVTKEASEKTYAPGDEVTYTITVKNVGETDAKGAKVYDVMPAGLTYKSSDPVAEKVMLAKDDPIVVASGVDVSGYEDKVAETETSVTAAYDGAYTGTSTVETLGIEATYTATVDNGTVYVIYETVNGDASTTKTLWSGSFAEPVDGKIASTGTGEFDGQTMEFTLDGDKLTMAYADSVDGDVTNYTMTKQVVGEEATETTEAGPVVAYVWETDVAAGESVEMTLVATVNADATGELDNGAAVTQSGADEPDSTDTATIEDETGKIVGKDAPQTGQSMMLWALVALGVAAIGAGTVTYLRNRRGSTDK